MRSVLLIVGILALMAGAYIAATSLRTDIQLTLAVALFGFALTFFGIAAAIDESAKVRQRLEELARR